MTPIKRRDFLKLSFASFAALSLTQAGFKISSNSIAQAAQLASETMPNGVAAGDTTQTSAILWTRSTAMGDVTFELAAADSFEDVVSSATATVSDPLVPVKVSVTGLTANTDYFYRATDSAGSVVMGYFRTNADNDTYTGLRFGATGDWRGELAPYPAIKNVPSRDLQFMLGIGDTIYADYASPALDKPQAETLEDYLIKHAEGYGTRFDVNSWAAVRNTMSWIPTIDDHEVSNDYAGGASPESDDRFTDDVPYINQTSLAQNGLNAFFAYNPIADTVFESDDDRMNGRHKIYRYFTYGKDASVMVLDARSFRDEPVPQLESLDDIGAVLGFLNATFEAGRTMLGRDQLEALKADLLDSVEKGVTWKFVVMPEPIQNMGPAIAQDRYEGYGAERAELLAFINDNNIDNVCFIAADIHGTLVNNLAYRTGGFAADTLTSAFEISTGSVAFYEPFGPTVMDLALSFGLVTEEDIAAYDAGSWAEKEAIMEALTNAQVGALNYPLLGLDNQEEIDAELLEGTWTATSTFGWTEFEIDQATQVLTITTYGIEPYSPQEIIDNTDEVLAREPQVVQKFTVTPKNFSA